MLALMLTMPREMGGFELPRPKINWILPVSPLRRKFFAQEEVIIDLSWPEQRVALEYYGWDEHFGAGRRKVAADATRANGLRALGWTVFTVIYEQVSTFAGITLLARQVAEALGVSLLPASELELLWRSRLLALLLPKSRRRL